MIIDNQVDFIKGQIDTSKKQIALQTALTRLLRNRDFKKIITEGFLKENVLNQVSSVGGHMVSEERKLRSIAIINSASILQDYFDTILKEGFDAENNAEALEEELIYAMNNDGEDTL